MRLVVVVAIGAIMSLMWVVYSAEENSSEILKEPDSSNPVSVATASDPYIRSIQGAQEARTRLESKNSLLESEIE
jgi:hypothetical protein